MHINYKFYTNKKIEFKFGFVPKGAIGQVIDIKKVDNQLLYKVRFTPYIFKGKRTDAEEWISEAQLKSIDFNN